MQLVVCGGQDSYVNRYIRDGCKLSTAQRRYAGEAGPRVSSVRIVRESEQKQRIAGG